MPVTHVESTPDVIAKYPNFQEFKETVMFGHYSDHPECIPSVNEDIKGFFAHSWTLVDYSIFS
jgi:hypothetical protein